MKLRSLTSLVILGIATIITACDWLEESKYSNCATAKDESYFIGEWLKNNGNARVSRKLTKDCVNEDKAIDGGDGNIIARVRWAVCMKGPDCDEAGMF